MMLANKFIKDTSIYILVDIVNKMVPFILLPILTRYLTPSDYGIISMFFVLTSILGVIMTIESNTAISIFFFKKSHEELKIFIANVLLIVSVLTSFLFLLSIIFSTSLTKLLSLPLEWIVLGIVVTFAQFMTTINLVLWQSEQNPIPVGKYQISQTLVNLSLSLVLIIGLEMNWEGRLIAISFASIIFGIYSFNLFFKRDYIKLKFDKDSIKEVILFGAPLLPHSLSVWFRTGIDRVFITTFISASATGMYTVAFQIASILHILCIAFNKAFAPYLYKKLKSINDTEKLKLVKYSYVYFLGLLFSAWLLGTISPYIVKYFLGSAFSDSQKYIMLLSFTFAFQGMYSMVVNYILFMKKTALLSYVTITISVLHIVLSYTLIQFNGLIGASQAALVTSIITFISVWWLSNKVYSMPWKLFTKERLVE